MGLRFGPYLGCLASLEMDSGTPEQMNTERTAQRVRTLIVIIMAVLKYAPFEAYVLVGRGAAPR